MARWLSRMQVRIVEVERSMQQARDIVAMERLENMLKSEAARMRSHIVDEVGDARPGSLGRHSSAAGAA